MPRVRLSGYSIIPEGDYLFKVTGYEYKEDYGKITLFFESESGEKHSEKFSLLQSDGQVNQQALKAFSAYCVNILNDNTLWDSECDFEWLIGSHVKATIEHSKSVGTDGVERTYAHMKNLQPVEEKKPNYIVKDSADEVPVPEYSEHNPLHNPLPTKEEVKKANEEIDIDSLFS